MKIGFDLDGVVYDFCTPFDNYMKRMGFGLKDGSEYELASRYGVKSEVAPVFLENFGKTRPFTWIPLNNEARQAMIDLSKEHELYIVTYRDWTLWGKEDTLERIISDNIPVDESNIVFSRDKGDYSKSLELDVFYEDSRENALDIIDKSSALVMMVDAAYNKIEHDRIKRIKW